MNKREYYYLNRERFLEKKKEELNTIEGRSKNLLRCYKKEDKRNNRGESDLTVEWLIDNILLPQVGKNRYMPCHFRHFIWTILDNRTHVNVTLPDGKLLKFTNRLDAVKWCDENQEKLK